jgi:hypothetical protein
MYERKKYYCGNSIEVEESHTGKYGAPGMKRMKRKKPTPEQMAIQNQWRRERDIRRLLKTNFSDYDYWLTLTYRPGTRPADMKEAKKQIRKFLRKMRDRYKARGRIFKYIVVTEIGSRGGIHHHAVINRTEDGDKLIADLWPYGGAHINLLYSRGEYRQLAAYIAKRPAKDNAMKEKWYSRSRNLKKPKVERKIMLGRSFSEKIRVPKGYYLEKESVYQGTNLVTGHPYRYYTLVKLNGRC